MKKILRLKKPDISKRARSVLLAIASVARRQTSPDSEISLTFLVTRLKMKRQELRKIVELLEQAGYLRVQVISRRVLIISLTMKGYEKADAWRSERRQRSVIGKIPPVIKVICASLFAAVLSLLWWWLGLSPNTSDWQPAGASVPIRMYDMGSSLSTVLEECCCWYQLPYPPERGQVIVAKSKEERHEINKELFPEVVPATRDGVVVFRFDVENIANRFQVNIESVHIKAVREDIRDTEDLYHFPVWGLGGGGVRHYELSLNPLQGQLQDNGTRIYKAVLSSKDAEVDYIFLKPGERESLEIEIKIATPGKYTLTPIVNFSFRECSSSIMANPYQVLYPRRYRTWIWESGSSEYESVLMSNNLVVDTQTNDIQMEIPSQQLSQPCLNEHKWIFFTSSMIKSGVLQDPFLVDASGNRLKLLKTGYYDPRQLL
ncbi:MAG TPA: hypothetical protein ENL17_02250, partial [Candidatus Methanoperedenaceae archaeon]|nr:hypothetical protein [Candidatus Methanoperedenaceae archaeon]